MSHHMSTIIAHCSCRYLGRRTYASSSIHLSNHDPNDFSRTVFIPRSTFPVRHDPKTELTIQSDHRFSETYNEQDPSRKTYLIHDGPPFANGQIHIGHAINKILKDISARYAMITGHRVEFITGWDCHGLPIELQVLKLIESQQKQSSYGGSLMLEDSISPDEFRAKARAYAKSQIDLQMASFKRIGILTDWNKRYTTDDPSYVANQLRAFSQLYQQKLIFKDLSPVNWSLTNRTTLAEADIDYRSNHVSQSAYVLCQLLDPPFTSDIPGHPVYAIVWTTTPWTLLENQAIAFSKQETYCIIKAWNQSQDTLKYMLASIDSVNNIQEILTRLGFQFEVQTYIPGPSLIGLKYLPLMRDSDPLPFLEADFVNVSKGTGLVHIAANYGLEDFNLIKKSGIPIKKGLVDPCGRYESEAGPSLAGKHIFTDGDQAILELLDQQKSLLFTEPMEHSFPYETRTNLPIMTRASQQIFFNTSMVIPRCLAAIKSASFFPEHRRRHFVNSLSSSPSWCISRQRVWGTPIPVFYESHDTSKEKMISHPLIVEHICKLLYQRRFMDYWWTADNSELIPQKLLDECKLPYKSEDLVRGMDIFDVWSDSGLSWHTTVDSINDNKSKAELYLEGTDQIRGWFSASTILSIALRGCLPSKRFFLHGFVLDENGHKMSKSQGNVIDPIKLFEKHGVDPVRLWAAKCAGDNNDVFVEKKAEESLSDNVNKIRLTLKYLIGAISDHEIPDRKLDHTKLQLFDQYFLDKLYRIGSKIDLHYKSYRYDLVVQSILSFINRDLSPIYIATSKDLLYCDTITSERRKSCLTVLNLTYNLLLRSLYPIIPHIVFESGQYMNSSAPMNEWQDLGFEATWKNDVLFGQFEMILKLRATLSHLMGVKFNKTIDQDAILYVNDKKIYKDLLKIINSEANLMKELFKTSTFILSYDDRLEETSDAIEHIEDQSEDSDTKSWKERLKLIKSWEKNQAQERRFGGSVMLSEGNLIIIEICFKNSSNRKCPRCRRYSVLVAQENENVCDRCKDALSKLDSID